MATFDMIMADAKDSMTVKRVFGEPIERGDTTVIPAAAVSGGGGGGSDAGADGSSGGGGFGVRARPIGAFEIRGEQVTWVPAPDITKMILLAEVALIAGVLATWSIVRGRQKIELEKASRLSMPSMPTMPTLPAIDLRDQVPSRKQLKKDWAAMQKRARKSWKKSQARKQLQSQINNFR